MLPNWLYINLVITVTGFYQIKAMKLDHFKKGNVMIEHDYPTILELFVESIKEIELRTNLTPTTLCIPNVLKICKSYLDTGV
jgi:hypothetical protein